MTSDNTRSNLLMAIGFAIGGVVFTVFGFAETAIQIDHIADALAPRIDVPAKVLRENLSVILLQRGGTTRVVLYGGAWFLASLVFAVRALGKRVAANEEAEEIAEVVEPG